MFFYHGGTLSVNGAFLPGLKCVQKDKKVHKNYPPGVRKNNKFPLEFAEIHNIFR